ncbi:MAG: hypothetical protein SPK91_08140 [Bacteroidales bacterium]|nr:hypothetical protein [Bacteroidales bacterium]
MGVYLLYSLSGVFSKYAAMQEFPSAAYIGYFAASLAVMGTFAIAWQQVLRHVELSTAFMFKGVNIIYMLIIVHFLFGEPITMQNIIGSAIIITGIILYAKS